MSVTLRQIESTDQRLDCRGLLPARLDGMNAEEIRSIVLRAGKRRFPLSELFAIEHDDDGPGVLNIHTTDGRIDFLGAGLADGRMIVHGDAGDFAGHHMLGGELEIRGDCADLAGSGLSGGVLRIRGNTGDGVGAPAAGERQGQRGGVIHVRGHAGQRAGERMRRGALIIEGNADRLLGYRMIAGTIYAGGSVATRVGYGMRRGTLMLRQQPATICPTLRDNGRHRLAFLPLLLHELQRIAGHDLGLPEASLPVTRYVGDLAANGRGEILIID